jgi:hypothetical protein
MHDLDRTLMEFESAADALESGDYERDGAEGERADDEYDEAAEFGARADGGEGEYEASYDGEYDGQQEDTESADDARTMELAAELLEARDDQELEEFFGKLLKRAARAAGQFAKSSLGSSVLPALMPVLKRVAKTALPALATGVGNFLMPGVGGAIGERVASTAGQMLGLELEGMSPQDQEFEVAKRVVQLSDTAAREALASGTSGPPAVVARDAVLAAASRHAPGLLGGRVGPRFYGRRGHAHRWRGGYAGRPQSGRWVRRGSRIILLGL